MPASPPDLREEGLAPVAAAAVAAAAATTAVAAATTATVAAAATAAAVTTTAAATCAGLRLEAVTAVDGTIATGLEGDLGFFAAGATGGAEHLAGAAAATSSARVIAPGEAAVGAPAGLVGEALGCVEFLLTSGERERGSAIGTG